MAELLIAKRHGVGIRVVRISEYKALVGDYAGFGHLPLWYVNYNQQDNFNDFTPFGGWAKPTMKSFKQIAKPGSDFAEVFYY